VYKEKIKDGQKNNEKAQADRLQTAAGFGMGGYGGCV
jgi:hypothetical protein